MCNTIQCIICGEILNLKSEEIEYLDDLPCHLECFEEAKCKICGEPLRKNEKCSPECEQELARERALDQAVERAIEEDMERRHKND